MDVAPVIAELYERGMSLSELDALAGVRAGATRRARRSGGPLPTDAAQRLGAFAALLRGLDGVVADPAGWAMTPLRAGRRLTPARVFTPPRADALSRVARGVMTGEAFCWAELSDAEIRTDLPDCDWTVVTMGCGERSIVATSPQQRAALERARDEDLQRLSLRNA